MITKDFVQAKYGAVFDGLKKAWHAKTDYDICDGQCLSIAFNWTTPNELQGMIGVAFEDDGFEIGSFLNRQNVHSGRNRSWSTPPSKLRARLLEIKTQLDSCALPPLGMVG